MTMYYYIIQRTIQTGNEKPMISYFQSFKMGIMKLMVNTIEEAKKYEYSSDAKKELRQYFNNSKGCKVLKLKQTKENF